MRSKSFSFLAVTTAALMFGALTDEASSHKLSSLAVRAFDSAVGTAIELVRPSAQKQAQEQSTTSARRAAAASSRSGLQSPVLATANPIETSSFETTLSSGGPATETDPKTREDEDVVSRASGTANFIRGSGRVRPAFSGAPRLGGSASSAVNQDASIHPAVTTETPADTLRLDGLMDLVASDLNRNYGAPSVGSPLDFTNPSKVSPPAGSPSGSSDSPSPEPGSPETTPPAASNPSPAIGAEPPATFSPPALVPPNDFSTSPPGLPPSGNPAEGSYEPPVPFDIVPDIGLGGLVPDPAVSPTDLVDDTLILPSNIAPVGLIPPPSAIDVPGALETSAIVNPEPATLLLFGTGLALVAHRVRRRSVR